MNRPIRKSAVRVVTLVAVTGSLLIVLTGAETPMSGAEKKQLKQCKALVATHRGITKDAGRIVGELAIARELTGRRIKAYDALAARLKEQMGEIDAVMKVQRGNFLIRLPASALFDSGQWVLKPAAKTLIAQVATELAAEEGRDFYVEGHTDNVAIAKKNKKLKSNVELSGHRALAVLRALGAGGVSQNAMAVSALGEFRPIAPNDSDEGRALNRRVSIVVMPRIDEIPVFVKELPGADAP